jgi:hypothetical protein
MQTAFKIKLALTLLIIIFTNISLLATIGSDWTSQSYYQLLAANNATNEFASGAFMDNGFYLTDKTTTGTQNSVYPYRGLINFNQGKFYLNRNMFCAGNTYFGQGGEIDGCGYTINLPQTPQTINFPDLNATKIFTGGSSTLAMVATVNSVSWSYDDKYIAGGANTGTSNLSVYTFLNNTLATVGTPITAGSNVTSVAWSPTNYYLAVGITNATNSITVYQWNGSTLTTIAGDRKNLTTGVNAVAWSPNGKFLAVSYATGASAAVQIYSYAGSGTLTAVGSAYVYGAAGDTTPNNTLSWQPNGSLLAIGKNHTTGYTGTLYVLAFNGSATPTLRGSLALAAGASTIGGVIFKPINSNSFNVAANYMSVAITSTNSVAKNLLYEYYAGSIQSTTRYSSAAETSVFNATSWSKDGMLCTFAGNSGTGNFRLCFAPENSFWYVNTNTYMIQSPTSLTTGANIQCSAFSNTSNNYIAVGTTTNLRVYFLNQLSTYRMAYLFNKTNLTLNSDLQLNSTVTVNGNCTINGNDNKLILGTNANLKIATGSTLNLQNIEIVGLNKSNLECLDNSGSIIIENSTLTVTSNFVFDAGSMLFNLGVKISGTNKFSYTSRMTSTINSYSMLYLDKSLTFSYAPVGAYRNLIYMPDNSAYLVLDGCTLHSSRTGLLLTSGQLFIDNSVALQSEGVARSQAIQFGNGTAKNDLAINLLAAAQLNITGRVEYANSF